VPGERLLPGAGFPLLNFFDQVNQYFRVGFADEGMAVIDQGTFQHGIVFNNAVVDQNQPTRAPGMWVGIGIVWFAVGSPAGVAHANVPLVSLSLVKSTRSATLPFFL
jgi:hypothetical protein